MKRLVVVLNPRSSRSKLVREKVIGPARKLEGFLVGKYEILPTDVDDNAARMAKFLRDGDLVVAAGGDATASVALNGCMLSGKEVIFAALPMGNFNDTARSLGNLDFEEIIERFSRGKTKNFYPLKVLVDDELFRYAAGYVTVGMFAESTKIFNERKTRKELKRGKSKIFSYVELAKWYFKNRKKEFLIDGLTDYIAMNGTSVAGIMKGKTWFLTRKFESGQFKLNGIFSLGKFMIRSVLKKVPGEETKKDVLEFEEKTRVMIQMEGEYKKLECEKIEILKDQKIKAIMR